MTSSDVKTLITPSVKTIKANFDEINRFANLIKTDIESVLDTLRVIDDTLSVFTNSDSLNVQLRTFNPIALSIPATVKLATEIITNYVTKKTGISFVDWAKFVNSILNQFGEFTNHLNKVAEVSLKYDETSLNNADIEQQEIDRDELLLVDVKFMTVMWKGYIEKTAKISVVIDAILDAQKETIKQATIKNESNNDLDFNSDVKKMLSAVTDKIDITTQNKAKELQRQLIKRLFSSVYDLKKIAKDFGNQTKDLLPRISDLENLLDLEIAQIQAYSGKIKSQEIEILGTRVAATITVPKLKAELTKLRLDTKKYKDILEKLNKEHKKNNINDSTYKMLLTEYDDELKMFTALLNQAEIQANIWKTKGVPVLENGIKWTQKELEIVRARKLVGQLSTEELKQRSKAHNQEISRLEAAKDMLASL